MPTKPDYRYAREQVIESLKFDIEAAKLKRAGTNPLFLGYRRGVAKMADAILKMLEEEVGDG